MCKFMLMVVLIGQCGDYLPQCAEHQTTHHIRNLSTAETSRHYISIRLVSSSVNYSMSIPVINGVVPTVTPYAGYTEFVLDYCYERPIVFDASQYANVTIFRIESKSEPLLQIPLVQRQRVPVKPSPILQRPLVPVRPSPILQKQLEIPRLQHSLGQDVQNKMKRPSQIK